MLALPFPSKFRISALPSFEPWLPTFLLAAVDRSSTMASEVGSTRGAHPLKPTKPPKRRKVGSSADVESVLASQCMKLHLVSCADDLVNNGPSTSADLSFPPVYLERFFGDDGRIHGYKDLKVDVWIHARSFHAYAEVHFTSQTRSTAPKKTDLQSKLQEVFQDALVEDRETFINNFALYDSIFEATLKEDGEVVTPWQGASHSDRTEPTAVLDTQGSNRHEIWRFEMEGERVKEWQSRMSCLALLFIDGANAIDVDDPLWEIYVCIERNSPREGRVASSRVAGFSAVYRFYHHPDSTRLRLSQILVLPPYQGKQYGFRLVEAVNFQAVERDCYDVTMEDPSESLQALRDCMDVLRLNFFDPVKPAVLAAIARLKTHARDIDDESLKKASVTVAETTVQEDQVLKDRSKELLLPPRSLVEAVRRTFKICSLQLKRCWEVLLHMYLHSSDAAVEGALKDLLILRLKSGIVGRGKDTKRCHRGKHVIVTDNMYQNEKTFVMLRANPKEVQAIAEEHRVVSDGLGCADAEENGDDAGNSAAEEEGKPDPAQVEEAVEALLRDRLAEIKKVAQKVEHLCISRGGAARGLDVPLPERNLSKASVVSGSPC